MDNKYYIYVIQSIVDNRLYIGLSEDVEKRLKSHNFGQTKSTKSYRPWKLVYSEFIGTRQEARKREKYFKSGCGKEQIKNFIK
jgi:putative endonuclease